MLSATSCSAPSVSVTYASIDVGLYYQDGQHIKYASMNRAAEIVAQMPESARKTLLAPIEQGLIDPQSVFFLIDDKCKGQIAICVEDFVQFASEYSSEEKSHHLESLSGGDDSVVPPRLLDAWRLASDKKEIEVYSFIDEECSTAGDKLRSRGESAISKASSSYLPAIPKSRPPAYSFSSFTTISSVGSSFTNQQNIEGPADLVSYETSDGFSSASTRKASAPEPWTTESSSTIAELTSSPSPLRKIYQNSYEDRIVALNTNGNQSDTCHNHIETKLTLKDKEPLKELEKFHRKKLEDIEYQNIICFRHKWISLLIAVIIVIFIAAGIALFFGLRHPKTTERTTTTAPLPTIKIYDCVNGSIATVVLDGGKKKLVDLNLPEKQPTRTNGSLEYLFVPNKAMWWYALKYCTAWCGYLVSIKGQEENEMILEVAKKHQPVLFSNYWIGLKAWKNKWYLDDESPVEYFNFLNQTQANEDIYNIDEIQMGCVEADSTGVWSLLNCRVSLPFVCERNTANENIRRTPFYPHQELKCSQVGGTCKYGTDCKDGHPLKHLCPLQTGDIDCCMPNKPKPVRVINSTIKTCVGAGGICNHVDADECRNGRVLFGLSNSCPDGPRRYDCCLENDEK